MTRSTKYTSPILNPGYVEYLRTSDEDSQAPERSQGYQKRLINQSLVEPSGLPLVGTYADTQTGKKINRQNYQRLLADARQGKFSHVGIAYVDRFGRNDVEGLRAFDELKALGIKVRIASYPSLEPEKSDARMVVGILFSMARFESDKTGERSKEGMIQKLYGGGWAWKAPDGYLNVEERKSNLDADERRQHAKHKHSIEIDPDRFPIMQLAFKQLLEDKPTLAEICEKLHSEGYTLPSGKPFVTIAANGKREAAQSNLSDAFHNWFYAGWVVVDNKWTTIRPEVIRGNWTPVVTTEEFKRGLEILKERNNKKQHKPKHFYLLQNLVSVKLPDGSVRKLTCSTQKPNREKGAFPYYLSASNKMSFLCRHVDAQISAKLHGVHVSDELLPQIRNAYMSDVDRYFSKPNHSERKRLEAELGNIDDAEVYFARQFQLKKLSQNAWEKLATEWNDRRQSIQLALQAMDFDNDAQIANLDDALLIISKASIMFDRLEQQGQRELLLHMIKTVVINTEGEIVDLEFRAPFGYLHSLLPNGHGSGPSGIGLPGNGTSSDFAAGSRLLSVCAPTGIWRHKTVLGCIR